MPASDGFSTRKLDVGDGLTITVRYRPITFGPFLRLGEQPDKPFDSGALYPYRQELCCRSDSKADDAQTRHGALSEDKDDAKLTRHHSTSHGTPAIIVDGKPPSPRSDVGNTQEHNSDRTGLLVWPGSRLLARFLADPRGARRHWPHLIPTPPDFLAEDRRGVADETAAPTCGTDNREQEQQHQQREAAAADIDKVVSCYTRGRSSGFIQDRVMLLNEDNAENRSRDERCLRCAPIQLASPDDPVPGRVRKSHGGGCRSCGTRCLDIPLNTTSAAAADHSITLHDVRDLLETLNADDRAGGSTNIVQICCEDYTRSSPPNDQKYHPLAEADSCPFGRQQQLSTAAKRSSTKEKYCVHCVERRSVHLSVLELGAGTGVCGLTAAIALGCCSVLVTDRREDVLDNVRHNVALNGLGDRITLASDTVYPGKPFSDAEAFFDVVKQVLDPDGVLLFAYTPRPPSIVTENMLCCAYLAGLEGRRLSYRANDEQSCNNTLRSAPESVAVAVTASLSCPRGGSNASPIEVTPVDRGDGQTHEMLREIVERFVSPPNLTDGYHDSRLGRKENRRSTEQHSRHINAGFDQGQRMQRPDDIRTIMTSCPGDAPCESNIGGVYGHSIDHNNDHQRKRPTKFGRERNDNVPPVLIAFHASTKVVSTERGTGQEDGNTAAENTTRKKSVAGLARWIAEWRDIFPDVHFRPTSAIAKSIDKTLGTVESLSDGREGGTWAGVDAFSSEMGREGIVRDGGDDCAAEELWGSGSD